ncbi:thiamine-phosphate kinase [Luteimonas sp. RIT-PG2_3]|jgi:thiamine-monophosphate kinase
MEFDLIARIRARAATRGDVLFGIGDDAAILQVPEGQQLIVTMDALNSGVHFPADTAPADIGWKALAVNLSDLAAMAATPAWCTLSLSLPEPDAVWLEGFLDGFLGLAALHGVALVGGDTTRGPLSISVAAHGLVDRGQALRRDGAQVGDDIWVTGTLGDAAAALWQWRASAIADPWLRARLDRPMPRIGAGLALRGKAHAAIDVSDGLLADLAHVCRASGVGADIDAAALPASGPLIAAYPDAAARHLLQASGGDDYELCFTAPAQRGADIAAASASAGVAATCIGRVVAGSEVRLLDADGRVLRLPGKGFEHFTSPVG